MKNYKGKAIYQPSGKAAEYSKWAVNFYNGCSAKCEYCYNRRGITAKVLGGDKPTLKKCFESQAHAAEIVYKEIERNLGELQKHGLFFNFVSDPFLKETWGLNFHVMLRCIGLNIPVKALTKQTAWIEVFLKYFEGREWLFNKKHLWAFGFTLTGHDELEPGAAANVDRIRAMKILNDEGFKTWASIEPIIDIKSSLKMIEEICNHVDLVKIGLQSGKKYDKDELLMMMGRAYDLADVYGFKVYFKDSFLKAVDIERYRLASAFCVDRDYKH